MSRAKDFTSDSEIPTDVALAELTEIYRELMVSASQPTSKAHPIEDERYEFIEEIARGGAAVVWRVHDRHLGRETAVKYLLDSQDNHEMRVRLEREARLCARLVHPGIVPIHELSSFADQRPFVSMKLVEGKTLLQLLKSDPPPSLKTTLEIFTKACQAIAYAHDKGIIHRDLKPGNIMVGAFGEVQIMDWGLAKDLTEKSHPFTDASPVHVDAKQLNPPSIDRNSDTWANSSGNETTIVGSVFGTIAYMSPEQANGKIGLIDKWSDVFSLGAVLCRLLTGVSPYQEIDKSLDQDAMLVRAQRGDLKAAYERLARAKPRKLADLARRCLAVQPTARPANVGEVVEELRKISDSAKRTTYAVGFLAVATSIMLIVTLTSIWANRGFNAENSQIVVTDPAPVSSDAFIVRELIHERVTLDSASAKVLLKSDQREVVLKNYRSFLNESPTDEQLHFSILFALMNSEKWIEGEEVARDLIKLAPRNADYHFMLSESLFWRGRYEEAKKIMLQSKALRDQGSPAQFPIDKNLSRLEKYIEIIRQVSSVPSPTFETLSSEELMDFGHACGQQDNFELAIGFYNRALSKESDAYQQTFVRNGLLLQFLPRNLRRSDLSDSDRNVLSKLCLDWLREQLQSIPKLDAVRATQLKSILASPAFDYARKLADDTRVEPKISDGLVELWKSIANSNTHVVEQ